MEIHSSNSDALEALAEGSDLPGMGETTTASGGGAFQGIALADDLDDEIIKYPQSSAAALMERQVTSGTANVPSGNSAESKPRYKKGRSTRNTGGEENPEESLPPEPRVGKTPFHVHIGIFLALFFGIAGIVVSIVALINANDENEDVVVARGSAVECDSSGEDCNLDEGPVSRLESIFERGYVNCGLAFEQVGFYFQTGIDSETQEPTYAGFDVDLCRAIAAAIFNGDSDAYRLHRATGISNFWGRLNSSEVDILFRPTRTMQRQVYIPNIDAGLEFSQPYFYDGLGFAGLEEFVECAENGIVNGTCVDLRICVLGAGTTHFAFVSNHVPIENLVVVNAGLEYYNAFPSICNVLAGEKVMVAEATLRQHGYQGEYAVGSGVYSREPLCMWTSRGDKRWTHFVDAVLDALIFAEERGITRVTAGSSMPETDLFGPQFERMFQNAVAFRGNYGELYVNNLEAFLPRNGLNALNRGNEPRILSYPFGNLEVEGPDVEDVSPTIKAIKEKGFINCGSILVEGLGQFNAAEKSYFGAQVDLCRAISAALFDGVDRTLITPLDFAQRLPALHEGRVDVVMTMPRTLQDDVRNPVIEVGVSFSAGYYFPGLLVAGEPQFVDCVERLDVVSFECQSLLICVNPNTAGYNTFSNLLNDRYLVPRQTPAEWFQGLETGECNVFVDGVVLVQGAFRSRGGVDATPYVIGSRLFSVASLGLATRDDDPVWSAFVDWILMSLIYAEENGIVQETAELMPRTNLFGPLRTDVFYHAVNSAGNYGELYERNWRELNPRSGSNLLNDNTGAGLYSFLTF